AGASAQETQRVSRQGAILFGAISANKYSPSPWPHRRIGRARDDCAAANAEYAARKSNASIAPSLIQRAIMRRIISLLPHEEGEFLVRLGVGQQLVPGLPGKALEILDRAGIGGEHLEDLPGLHAAQRLLGAQNRQRAIQAARVEFPVKIHKVLCRMDKPRPGETLLALRVAHLERVLRAQVLEARVDHRQLVEIAVAGGARELQLLDRRRQAALQSVELGLRLVLQQPLAERGVGLRLQR